MPAGPFEAQAQFVYTFKARLVGSSPSDIVVHQIPKMTACASPPGSILRTILGAFACSGGWPDRLPIVSMWTKRLNFGWRHRRQNLLLALWLCRQDREYEVRKQ
jgi:hypothetical protein